MWNNLSRIYVLNALNNFNLLSYLFATVTNFLLEFMDVFFTQEHNAIYFQVSLSLNITQ